MKILIMKKKNLNDLINNLEMAISYYIKNKKLVNKILIDKIYVKLKLLIYIN